MDISVLLASYKRHDILSKTLESFSQLDLKDIHWEILLVNNADDEKTRALVESYKKRLPVQYLVEPRQGKNFALNQAVGKAGGDLLVFTDDDVVVERNWLKEYVEGIKRWPEYSVFGGRILPLWPPGLKPLTGIKENFFQSSYSIADWKFNEGPYDAGKVWGPNMAIRKKIFERGFRFNEQVGPSGNNYIMGSETELTKRLQAEGFKSVYLPRALVHHQIRPEQMKYQWLYQRAFRYGRADTYHESHPRTAMIFGVPRYMYRLLGEELLKRWQAVLLKRDIDAVNSGINYWMLKGRIFQYRLKSKEGSGRKQDD